MELDLLPYQFNGVVIGNIDTAVANAVKIIHGVRRELIEVNEDTIMSNKNSLHADFRKEEIDMEERNLKKLTPKPKVTETRAPRAPKKGKPSSTTVINPTLKPTVKPESNIPSASTLATAILTNGASAITNVLDTIVDNPSFVTDVLSGGDVTTYQANIDKVKGSIDILATQTMANPSDQPTFDSLIAEIQALLDLLKSAVEK